MDWNIVRVVVLIMLLSVIPAFASAQYPHEGISPYARARATEPVAPTHFYYGERPKSFAWGYFGASRSTQSVWHRSYHGDWHQVRFSLGY